MSNNISIKDSTLNDYLNSQFITSTDKNISLQSNSNYTSNENLRQNVYSIQELKSESTIIKSHKRIPVLEFEPISEPIIPIKKSHKRIPVIEFEPIPEPIIRKSTRRKNIPASVKNHVWNHYIGEDINKHRCLCCKKVPITNRAFHVGHVISVKDGGSDEISNLRPICPSCNYSMGTENMVEFVKTYGYYIG